MEGDRSLPYDQAWSVHGLTRLDRTHDRVEERRPRTDAEWETHEELGTLTQTVVIEADGEAVVDFVYPPVGP